MAHGISPYLHKEFSIATSDVQIRRIVCDCFCDCNNPFHINLAIDKKEPLKKGKLDLSWYGELASDLNAIMIASHQGSVLRCRAQKHLCRLELSTEISI